MSRRFDIDRDRKVKLPTGWRPQIKVNAFGRVVFEGLINGGDDEYTEAEAHFALATMLEHQQQLAEAIRNVRLVLADLQSLPAQRDGSIQSLVGDLRSALDSSFSCVDENNAKVLAPKVDAALERADRFLEKPPRE